MMGRTVSILGSGRTVTVTVSHDPAAVGYRLSLSTGRGVEFHATPYRDRQGIIDLVALNGLSRDELIRLGSAITDLAIEVDYDSKHAGAGDEAELAAMEVQDEHRKEARQRFYELEGRTFIKWSTDISGFILTGQEERAVFLGHTEDEAIKYLEEHPEAGKHPDEGESMADHYRRLEYMLENELAWWHSTRHAYVALVPGSDRTEVVELGKTKDEAASYLLSHPGFPMKADS